MKLRNKKTGEIMETHLLVVQSVEDPTKRYYTSSIKDLCDNYEDYKPAEPLIKDDKLRKAVRAWADYHNTTEVNCSIGDWDHRGLCIFDSVLQLNDYRNKIVIQFFMNDDKREKIKEGIYTIAELCGEEEDASV